jgi:hypothetical protein
MKINGQAIEHASNQLFDLSDLLWEIAPISVGRLIE